MTETIECDLDGNIKSARVITTDLWNYAMPFIRYDTQDLVQVLNSDCSCGKKLFSVKKIIGRDVDILVSATKGYVTPHIISVFFKSINGINQFQVRQDDLNLFHIYLKSENNNIINNNHLDEIKQFWVKYFGIESICRIQQVNEIPLSQSGKRRYIIRSKKIPI
jgi:phenylacetate-CoA ligase